MTIKLETARAVVAGARDHARAAGLKPLAIVVLDSGGHVVAAEREDGASIKRIDVAHGKAFGALSLGMGSRALMERAEKQAYFIAAVTQVVGALVPVPGGVLIVDESESVVGAVGVSGDTSDNDEASCLAGVAAVGLGGRAD